MPITRNEARQLTTRTERELVDQSFQPAVRKLSPARLRAKLERSRRLRDKYLDLERRQGKASKGREKGGGRARDGADARTARKTRLFAETLARFEKRLAAVEAEQAAAEAAAAAEKERRAREAASAAAAAETRRRAARAKPPRKTPAPAPKPPRPPSRLSKGHGTRSKAVRGHVKGRGQRRQARRDSR